MKYLAVIFAVLPILQSFGGVVLRSDPRTLTAPAAQNNESVQSYCQRVLQSSTCVDNDATPYILECQDAETVQEATEIAKNILDTADLRCKEFVGTLLDSDFAEDKKVGVELKSRFALSVEMAI